ncbi:Farnesyl pyrophosphate synthase 1, mitochondrial [Papilio machaon]|uniref:Farnesyl pyrophosphate synthase 1, mitochondrial n=1 Tax=Papilio machaon TaxID=76193 RepID=A0A194RB57_PAPMA|nr:Farnesyl pyrophosphate synthase 1, mitochondrial [Papilio machaon]
MPPVFHLDRYELCIDQTGGIYCIAEIDLVSDSDNDLLKMIHEYSARKETHFNHSRLHYGICLTKMCKDYLKPNTTSSKDLNLVIEKCLNTSFWEQYKLKTRIKEDTKCHTQEQYYPIEPIDIVVAVILLSIFILNLAGSVYDILIVKKNNSASSCMFNRLTPPYAAVLAISATWLRFAGSGPFWEIVSSSEDKLELISIANFQKKQSPLMKRIINDFNNYVPKVVDESLAKMTFVKSSDMKDRIKKASEYYTVGRNPVQGEFMLFAFESMNKDLKITDELVHQLQVVVTTVEMVQSYFFFWDDLEDNSLTRLNKPCWHLVDNIGMMAFNDACILRSYIDEVLRQNFNLEMRDKIMNAYHQLYFNAAMGQHFDAEVARSRNYDNYTMETYDMICLLKSSSYAIKSPLTLALILSNKWNKESIDIVENLAVDIGILIQCHNDLIDYYNTKGKVTGKSGSDIQTGKCSWVAAAVLENCSAAQRRIFIENYGNTDPEKGIVMGNSTKIVNLQNSSQFTCVKQIREPVRSSAQFVTA